MTQPTLPEAGKKKLGVFFPKRLNNRKAALNNRNVPTPRIPGDFFFLDSQTASLSSGSTGVVCFQGGPSGTHQASIQIHGHPKVTYKHRVCFFIRKNSPPPPSFAVFFGKVILVALPFKKNLELCSGTRCPKKEKRFPTLIHFQLKINVGNAEKFGPNCHPYVHAFLPSEVESTPVLCKI